MKKVVLNLAVTLDGFIEGPNGEVDWCIMDEDMNFPAFIESIDTIFYGRISYDEWGNYQPDENADLAEKEMWNGIHSKNKFVFSSQNRDDENAVFITADLITKVNEIKNQQGKDIWLYGGASLIKTFINLNLIDVYKISVHPIVLGSGKPLFENLSKRIGLKLMDTRVFKSGVVELTYQPE
ncbi:dihydrofolate reductase family protein [Flavobacterium sp. KACC 22758]|jgi:dihydrofolate reductase|uniref:dihydrofolate reductase family protein n=1 Tax=Flavobacterium sp. KACC 22758 TaxID=3025667 RepID=UPI0023659F4B|nr:dihydrofolate reductase family protein [Flavobacterium sp. KACC 22758]WDF58948.1 dihydrofolate reductase family protein [Flavobacterium sp. KACC 22758]